MPCMGPSDRKDDAEQAFKEIAKLLTSKYGMSDITQDETFGMFKKEFNDHRQKLLEELIHVFQWDSYNSF